MVADTADFYLRKCRPLVDYVCSLQNGPTAHTIDTGYSLTFSVIMGHLTPLVKMKLYIIAIHIYVQIHIYNLYIQFILYILHTLSVFT